MNIIGTASLTVKASQSAYKRRYSDAQRMTTMTQLCTYCGLHTNNIYHSPWILFVKKIPCDGGFSGVWQSQTIPTIIDPFNNNILQRLRDQLIQQWKSDIANSPKSIHFRMLKLSFERENYLTNLPPAL